MAGGLASPALPLGTRNNSPDKLYTPLVPSTQRRVAVYIDGLNLYYGLKSRGWRRYYWLDVRRLAESLLLPDQSLVLVRYFAARVSARPGDPDKPHRQDTYLKALATLPAVALHFGYFLPRIERCRNCGETWQSYEEKRTDVNIAAELLGDAQDDAFDTAMIISADGDLASVVQAVRSRYRRKQFVAAFPPGRHSSDLRKAARKAFTIGEDALRGSQFPDRVLVEGGAALERPRRWL